MRWVDVRETYPDQWLVIEALVARTIDRWRTFDRIAVVEACADGTSAMKRYRSRGHLVRSVERLSVGGTGIDEPSGCRPESVQRLDLVDPQQPDVVRQPVLGSPLHADA